MLYDLSRFRSTEDHLDRRFQTDAFSLEGEEFHLSAPVHLVADLHKDGRKVRAKGRIVTTLEAACVRCLDPLTVPVDTAFDVMFLPAGEPVVAVKGTSAGKGASARKGAAAADDDEDGQEVSEDDLGVSFYKDEVLDLGELMREQFILALPMKPLCRDACAGLCPVCGINRNRETCTCQSEWVDPRMEALRRLTDRS
jgi:uncharacterized protein